MTRELTEVKRQLLDAALPHVAFDGWSPATFRHAVEDAGVDPAIARSECPRGAVDLAMAFHLRGDEIMRKELAEADLSAMRFRDRIAHAVRLRLEAVADNKEAVRRGATLFSLPQYAPEGAKAIWETADAIWNQLDDTSDDINWYTKRATLSAVYSATLLFWLGDDSLDSQQTWDFLDRRIDNVMQFEKAKARAKDNPLLRPLVAGTEILTRGIRAPGRNRFRGMPGSLGRQRY
jgi:ubiquinone biosynthesis protein COQ9